MTDLAWLLENKTRLKRKILAMPKPEARRYREIIKILVLSDRQAIDALAAAYFYHKSGVIPIPSDHVLPREFVIGFRDDKQFFSYLSNLLRQRIGQR